MKANKNNKGFTLVELLATMVILGVLSLVAIPNIVGVVQNSKYRTYVEDAKKVYLLGEQKMKSGTLGVRPTGTTSSTCVCILLDDLDSSELSESPNGSGYDKINSYVRITKVGTTYKYAVRLVERANNAYMGVIKTNYTAVAVDDLYNTDNISSLVNESSSNPSNFQKVECSKFSA